MANEGIFPIDASTAVGLFRFEVGDVVGTPHTAPADGKADFEFMSDAVIGQLLAQYPDRATAKAQALNSMATQLITQAQDIQVDDIRIKTVERANLMLTLASGLGVAAATDDANSAFQVVPLTSTAGYYDRRPQGTPARYGQSGF